MTISRTLSRRRTDFECRKDSATSTWGMLNHHERIVEKLKARSKVMKIFLTKPSTRQTRELIECIDVAASVHKAWHFVSSRCF